MFQRKKTNVNALHAVPISSATISRTSCWLDSAHGSTPPSVLSVFSCFSKCSRKCRWDCEVNLHFPNGHPYVADRPACRCLEIIWGAFDAFFWLFKWLVHLRRVLSAFLSEFWLSDASLARFQSEDFHDFLAQKVGFFRIFESRKRWKSVFFSLKCDF